MVYVVGHRGAAGVQPENTLKGFRYALELGVDYVECDVHLTRDGHLVVMHDATVNRTTNGAGAIRDLTFERIRRLDAGDGEQVPTLDEVLETVRGRARLLCELKGMGVEEAAVAAVRAHGMEEEVTFTSFSLERLARVRELGSHYRIGAILPNATEFEIARAAALAAVGIGVHYKNLCLRILEEAHQAGLEVRAWNPDTLPEQQAMIALGVDGISTNRPDILIAYLRRSTARLKPELENIASPANPLLTEATETESTATVSTKEE
ncbi:MAG TPA: glycerophosphodiester phosphodiesterase family protein [Caldilineaceae bacterium]|nr:glycerophosphodiester phosphodiesterase family protein [Caldilineaceae bacterium]